MYSHFLSSRSLEFSHLAKQASPIAYCIHPDRQLFRTTILLSAVPIHLSPLYAVFSFLSSLAFLPFPPNLSLAFQEPSGPTALLAALCNPC